jgi:hypothetical protein
MWASPRFQRNPAATDATEFECTKGEKSMTKEQQRAINAAIDQDIAQARAALPNGTDEQLTDWVMEHCPLPSDIRDALAKERLTDLMREMYRCLERIGVVHIAGPGERIIVLRKPGMREFQDAAIAGGLPAPSDWAQFYELTFGAQPIEEEKCVQ